MSLLLFKFASCCTLCHYCCLNLHLAVHYVTTVVSFSLSQLTHLKTFLPVCDQQSLLLIDRDVTVVRCQCCSWLCSNSGMAICRGNGERYLCQCNFLCHEAAVMSPCTEPDRSDMSPEACRLELRRNVVRRTVWRVAYSSCSVLAVWVADSDVSVVDNDDDNDHEDCYCYGDDDPDDDNQDNDYSTVT